MGALGRRVAALEVAADTAKAIGRVVMMIGGPNDIEAEAIMDRFGIPTQDDDFYIRVCGLEPDPAGPKRVDLPCGISIGGKWLVVDDKRTEAEL